MARLSLYLRNNGKSGVIPCPFEDTRQRSTAAHATVIQLAPRQQALNPPADATPIHRFVHDPSSSSDNKVKNRWNEFSSSAAHATASGIAATVEENLGK